MKFRPLRLPDLRHTPRRMILSHLLIWLGVTLIVLSLGQYAWMEVAQFRLQHQWREAEILSPEHLADAVPGLPGSGTGAVLIRLQIPSIHLDDMVVRGTTYRDLLAGPGLLKGSPLPGDRGNSVLAAHRDTYFRHISDLKQGDTILVRRDGRLYTFRITQRKIVSPDDTSVLAPSRHSILTLVTCYPTYWIGPAPFRLIYQAKLQNVQEITALTASR
jgi:sortase A